MVTGLVFNIQQFSTEDGPGIRTTVFMKGCPLHCIWCHNPEGLSPRRDLMWHDVRCVAARECLRVCPENALALTPQGLRVDRAHCSVCGKCAEACPAAALEIIGQEWSPEALVKELVKDRAFFETSGGGVTFSGGEPMQQLDFLYEVMALCKESGLEVALDTCGAAGWDRYRQILDKIDLVLLDLKLMDSRRHQQATGTSNTVILDNARHLTSSGMRLWVRTPIIPGYTSDEANVRAIGQFIRDALPTVERWDLLAYTNLGKPKYRRLDYSYSLKDASLFTRAEMEALWQVAVEAVPVAHWSGATR